MASMGREVLRRSISGLFNPSSYSWSHGVASCLTVRPFSSGVSQFLGPFDSGYSVPPASHGMNWSDKIHLRGLVFHGFHGAVPEENVYGQKFVIDATLYLSLRCAGTTDKLENSVNYAEVFRSLKRIVEGPYHILLESLAERLASEVLSTYPMVQGVTLQIRKPQVHLEGVMDSVGIEMSRFRKGALLPTAAKI